MTLLELAEVAEAPALTTSKHALCQHEGGRRKLLKIKHICDSFGPATWRVSDDRQLFRHPMVSHAVSFKQGAKTRDAWEGPMSADTSRQRAVAEAIDPWPAARLCAGVLEQTLREDGSDRHIELALRRWRRQHVRQGRAGRLWAAALPLGWRPVPRLNSRDLPRTGMSVLPPGAPP